MNLLPWVRTKKVEKYRPTALDQVVSNDSTISTIRKFVETRQIPHMLLHGPPGTGKTSTILAIANTIYEKQDISKSVLQLNASDDRGIGVVRETIKTFAQTRSSNRELKLVILDEADQMTHAAQNALRRVMEDFAFNVRFCFVCNYAHKMHSAIQSRCTRFRFHPLIDRDVMDTIRLVCSSEGVDLTDDGLLALLKIGRGDMRRILNTLQSCYMAHGKVPLNCNLMMGTLGLPLPNEVDLLLNNLFGKCFNTVFTEIENVIRDKGYSVADIAIALQEAVWNLDIPDTALITLMCRFGDMEKRLADGSNEFIEIGALVGMFIEANVEHVNVYRS